MKIAVNIFKIFILIFVFVVALWILIQNSGQYVDINLLTLSYQHVNLIVVVLLSLTIGAVLGVVLMAFAVIQSHSEIRSLKAKNRQLMNELENLRNISVEEIPDEDISPLPTSTTKIENQE